MISTFLGFQVYGNNIAQTLTRTANEKAVSQAQAYFNANIGKVTTVGDLVNNYRLLSYATKAFGLGDMTNAKALLTQVLTSDLTSSKSVANKLRDSRYTAFAHAFGFDTKGNLKAPLQTSSQQAATESLFVAKTSLGASAATAATKAYETAMASVTSVSDLERNPAALGYVLIAYGIDPNTASAGLDKTIESALSDPKSFLNQQPNAGYTALAAAFNVAADGSTSAATQAQTTDNVTSTTNAYMSAVATDTASQRAAATETSYYTATISAISSVGQLLADTRLTAYVTKAFGLPKGTDATSITRALTSDLSSAASFANSSAFPAYRTIARAFNFTTSGIAAQVPFQSASQQQSTVQLYMQRQTATSSAADAATAYYEAKIGAVKSVSDLQSDQALLKYVITAYGIDPATPQATVAAVLEKSTSLDKGYLALAREFSVSADGSAAAAGSTGTANQVQTDAQKQTTMRLYADRSTAGAASTQSATAYFQANIGTIHSVSALVGDAKLLDYVVTAYGLDPKTPASIVTSLLQNTGGISDAYRSLADAFTIDAGGATQAVAQTSTDVGATIAAYKSNVSPDSAVQAAATVDANSYASKMAGIKSVDDLVGNSSLVSFVKTAFGLPNGADASTIKQALTSDLSSSTSFAQTNDPSYLTLAKTFNFSPAGTLRLQTTVQQQSAEQLYANNTTADASTAAAATAYYKAAIANVQSIGDLQGDPRILSYLSTAYGVDLTTSPSTVVSVLDSTHSILDTSGNSSLLALHSAFSVDAQGKATSGTVAQSATDVSATTQAYLSKIGTSMAAQASGNAATIYYRSAIAKVTSASDLLNDPKLVGYLKIAFDLSATTTNATLRKVLTSNVTDPKSVASTMGAGYKQLATALNFSDSGLVAPQTVAAASKSQLNAINSAYLEQQLETEAGAQNPGIALALYFQANASKVTDAYSILADKKLTVVFQTMLGLPATASSADIDAQAKTISSRFNLADLKDPKKLKDLIQRFSVLYDLNPPASTSPYTIASVFSGSVGPVDVTSLFGGGGSAA